MKQSILLYYITIGFFTTIALLLSTLPAKAEIYKYIDSNGVLHFTDVPVSSQYKLFVEVNPEKGVKYSSEKYDWLIFKASKTFGIPFSLVKAMIKVESDFDTRAVSRAGAKGLMQIMPFNFKDFNISDPFNPKENIFGGTRYLSRLLNRYEGRLPMALAAYNAGPTMVDHYKNIPPFPETRRYVKKVMRYYYAYKR